MNDKGAGFPTPSFFQYHICLSGFFLENQPRNIPPLKNEMMLKNISAASMNMNEGSIILV